jgi:hypothetical protein
MKIEIIENQQQIKADPVKIDKEEHSKPIDFDVIKYLKGNKVILEMAFITTKLEYDNG